MHRSTILDKLHGYSEVRVVKTESGGTEHRTYTYPGVFSKVWHRRLFRGAFVVISKHDGVVVDFFKRYRVPYARATVKEINMLEKLGAV